MFHTLIIDSSDPGTGEFKESRSVNSTPGVSSLFLYLDLMFLHLSFAQLESQYVFIQVLHPFL